LKTNCTPGQFSLGLQLLEHGLKEFPKDPVVLFVASVYFDAFFGDRGAKKSSRYIEEVKRLNPSFAMKFQLYTRERLYMEQRKASKVANGEQLHVLESAEFQNLDKRVKREHFLALTAVRDFWEGVRNQADIFKLSNAVERLAYHGKAAKESYNRLLVMFPENKSILQSYAQFLFAVEGDSDRGNSILEMLSQGI
jgi:hypothetical protein